MPDPIKSEWKDLSKEKPEVGKVVMVAQNVDQYGNATNVTVACRDSLDHWRFSLDHPKTIGFRPLAWRNRF